MKKIIHMFKDMHWPTKKEILSDTSYVIGFTLILSIAVYFWNYGLDKLIKIIF